LKLLFLDFLPKKRREKSFDTSFWFIFGLAAVFLISILIFSAPLSVILDYAKNPEFLRWFAMIAFWMLFASFHLRTFFTICR
jgi:hypothetical protein